MFFLVYFIGNAVMNRLHNKQNEQANCIPLGSPKPVGFRQSKRHKQHQLQDYILFEVITVKKNILMR